MLKTYKYRLYPSKMQITKLESTLETCRILYNSCLVDRKNRYEQTGKGLNYRQQADTLVTDKQHIPLLKDIHSQVLQDVLRRVDKSFKNFFRRVKTKEGKAGYPRYKPEGRYDSLTYPQQPGFGVTPEGRLHLAKIGDLKIRMHREMAGKVKTCTVKREGHRWYACFSVECTPERRAIPSRVVGIDVGLNKFAVLSDGTEIDNPRHLRQAEKRLARKQRQLSSKQKGSGNRKKARRQVAELHRKVRNRRADFQHKISREIVNTYGFIAVEDLQIRNMVRNRRLSKSISDAGWGGFLDKLAYKAEEAGCWFVKVPPAYTSIDCSGCGLPVPKTLATRVHKCPRCGLALCRDRNAAINILHRALGPNTAGTAGIHARGEVAHSGASMNREALSLAAG